jgi:DNA polymerase (family 10)
MHSKWSDGSNSLEEMISAAQIMGYEYIAITDHSGGLRIARGMDDNQINLQLKKIEKLNEEFEGITIFKGLEVNIDSDGKLDVDDRILNDLDIVIASIHSGFRQDRGKLTDRIISAMENEYVNIIAHPTGRKIHQRKAYELDLDKVFESSIETDTYLEVNSQPDRLDLKDVYVKKALEAGCKLVINTDSHNRDSLKNIEFGIATARRGWAGKEDIVNTKPLKEIKKFFKK